MNYIEGEIVLSGDIFSVIKAANGIGYRIEHPGFKSDGNPVRFFIEATHNTNTGDTKYYGVCDLFQGEDSKGNLSKPIEVLWALRKATKINLPSLVSLVNTYSPNKIASIIEQKSETEIKAIKGFGKKGIEELLSAKVTWKVSGEANVVGKAPKGQEGYVASIHADLKKMGALERVSLTKNEIEAIIIGHMEDGKKESDVLISVVNDLSKRD